MKFGDMVAQAFDSWDANMAIQISRLCGSCGLNAEGTWEYVQKHRPNAERAEWEALLYEGDVEDPAENFRPRGHFPNFPFDGGRG